ncbi:MAG: hypothetical protein JWN11_2218 [Hyphomicrobiales bacterium]|nr:hypothetical protein [Hyphomicrobiales bacterium]
MAQPTKIAQRLVLLLIAALASYAADVSISYAQSANCQQLTQMLRSFDRNGDFRGVQQNSDNARQLAADVQDAESAYVRTGCQAAQQNGERQSMQCRGLARQILSGRAQYANLAKSVQTGNALLQQRESVLQEFARFSCDSRSTARVINNGVQQQGEGYYQAPDRPRPQNFFERLFGVNRDNQPQDNVVDDPYANGFPSDQAGTIRTVCVRASDGYFWPISYATLPDYIQQDEQQCHEQCPGLDVSLYYYDNPGQEPEQMVSVDGTPYSALPTAFKYRTEFDKTATCKTQAAPGSISLDPMGDGQSRATIHLGDVIMPMPLRDPRRPAAPTIIAASAPPVASVPLPRRRPSQAGEPAPLVKVPVATAAADQRVVEIGGKRVRIVGPETPYAQPAGAKS